MRIFLLHIIMILLTAAGLAGTDSFTQGKSIVVKVTNSLDLDRSNEIVVLKWNNLQKYIQILCYEKISVCDTRTSDTLVTQFIDEDQNGIPEELIFCSDFKARETKQFVVKVGNKQTKTPQSLTFARLMIPREDLAWENDRNAFRIYGPPLAKDVDNGIDVWTKRVRYPIVEKWYKGDEAPDSLRISYHEDHGEGADFFSVGRTLGAGGSALYSNGSLYQPGVFAASKILATGPLRTIFEVTYKPVKFNGRNISEVKRFTLDAGSNLNKIEVKYLSDSLNNAVPFAAGLVKRKDVTVYSDKMNRWISLWGLTNEKEENGSLGTGIVMSNKAFSGIHEDSVHVLFLGTAKIGIPSTYYTGAAWTRSGDFHNANEWNKYLEEFSLRLKSPLKISVEINKKVKVQKSINK
jgi:pectinesterase